MNSFPIIDGSQLANAPGGLVLLDFWQASCAPCRALEPRNASLKPTLASSPATGSTSTPTPTPSPGTAS